jgi:hypothetical protein
MIWKRHRTSGMPQLLTTRTLFERSTLPPEMCMYCHTSDPNTEEFPTLLGKFRETRNKNNQNVFLF